MALVHAPRIPTHSHLLALPPELLHHILTFLDLQSLLACSRTCHALRPPSLSPALHRVRRALSIHALTLRLAHRPPLSSLKPPASTIYLSPHLLRARALLWRLTCSRLSRNLSARPPLHHLLTLGIIPPEVQPRTAQGRRDPQTAAAARRVSRELRRIRLGRNLERRPSVGSLVDRGVLPIECCGWDGDGNGARNGKGRLVFGTGRGAVSPGLVGVKRSVEKERVKDGLRGWVEGKLRRRQEAMEEDGFGGARSVRGLVGLFSYSHGRNGGDFGGRGSGSGRWGRGWKESERRAKDQPTRAKVLGLRRFWEGVIRKGEV